MVIIIIIIFFLPFFLFLLVEYTITHHHTAQKKKKNKRNIEKTKTDVSTTCCSPWEGVTDCQGCRSGAGTGRGGDGATASPGGSRGSGPSQIPQGRKHSRWNESQNPVVTLQAVVNPPSPPNAAGLASAASRLKSWRRGRAHPGPRGPVPRPSPPATRGRRIP